MKRTTEEINGLDRHAFIERFGAVFEHSPWVADAAWNHRPFRDRAALHAAMCAAMQTASEAQQLALIRAHPDLVGRAAREGRLGAASASEQAGVGLDRLTPDEIVWFEQHNAAYRERFGFPFIICVRANRKHAIITGFETRLHHTSTQERATALAEIEKIAAFRLADLVADPED